MNLTEEFIEEMTKRFDGQMIEGVWIKDFLHEDYAYVMEFLHLEGIEVAKCDVWCDECDCEVFNVSVNTDTFDWECPKCGTFRGEL